MSQSKYKEACDEKRFLSCVKDHQLVVVHDDGVFRNIRLAKPGSNAYMFELVTWPGHLAYTGDVGSFMFSHSRDMFEFFRGSAINPGYWSEKLVAARLNPRGSSHEDYKVELFRDAVMEAFMWMVKNNGLSLAAAKELRQEVRDQILNREDEIQSYELAFNLVSNFKATIGEEIFTFQDVNEWNVMGHSFRYLWCCYALVWGIAQYDAYKAAQSASTTAA
ncbi:hypothetical protein ACYPKM_00525 [Pseudomonas aeruginosa]